MSITFHCEHCGKKIEAQDSAGGRWGKCPACHNKLYVPNLSSGSEEELKLAPIDDKEEARRKQLMAETYKISQDILLERENSNGPAAVSASQMNEKELTTRIITYLRQVADGQLDQAEKTAHSIAPYSARAVKIIDKIALSEIPEPELADIPQQVLSSLIRALRGRIG